MIHRGFKPPLPLGEGRGEGFRATVDDHPHFPVGQSLVLQRKVRHDAPDTHWATLWESCWQRTPKARNRSFVLLDMNSDTLSIIFSSAPGGRDWKHRWLRAGVPTSAFPVVPSFLATLESGRRA